MVLYHPTPHPVHLLENGSPALSGTFVYLNIYHVLLRDISFCTSCLLFSPMRMACVGRYLPTAVSYVYHIQQYMYHMYHIIQVQQYTWTIMMRMMRKSKHGSGAATNYAVRPVLWGYHIIPPGSVPRSKDNKTNTFQRLLY